MPNREHIDYTSRDYIASWMYLPVGLPDSAMASKCLEDCCFILDIVSERNQAYTMARIDKMKEAILSRRGKIFHQADYLPPGKRYIHVTCGQASLPSMMVRKKHYHYFTESKLSHFIEQRDGKSTEPPGSLLRSVQSLTPSPPPTPDRDVQDREMTLSTALANMVNFGTTFAGRFTGTIVAPSGGVAYANSDEEIDAIDDMLGEEVGEEDDF